MLAIDGSQKSGSGTIVRCAVALAALLGEELSLTNIRARRDQPGLRPQHLQAVEAVAHLVGAELDGARVGSSRLRFRPSGPIRGGTHLWDIGTAGSTTLLAMTLLPVAAFAREPCSFRLQGGLFQDFAPTAYHLQHVLLSLLERMGLRAEIRIVRPGYVPKGGGIIEMEVPPMDGPLRALSLVHPGKAERVWGVALSSHLEGRRVSDRMAERCRRNLAAAGLDASIEVAYDRTALQPGAALAVFARTDAGCIFGADGAGAPGRPSEAIAHTVARRLLDDLESGGTVDRHAADQLVIYGALAEGTTEYIVPSVTEHVETNCWLAREILGADVDLVDRHVRIRGIGYRRTG